MFIEEEASIEYLTPWPDDAVTPLAGQQTCNSQIAGLSPGWAPLHSGLGQTTYTCVPLSKKQHNLVHARG